jgi:hypothetical protein
MRRFALRPVQTVPGGFRQAIVLPPAPASQRSTPAPGGSSGFFDFVVALAPGVLDDPIDLPVSAAVQCYGVPWSPETLEAIACGGQPFASPRVWGWDTVEINGVSDTIQDPAGNTVQIGGFVGAELTCKSAACYFVAEGNTVTFSSSTGAREPQTFPLYVINDGCF